MATLRGIGSAVGEYIGDGQEESSTVEPQLTSADVDIDDADLSSHRMTKRLAVTMQIHF